jgi:hypothetical protein
MVDPQDLSQWRFWVVPTGKLNGERKSIRLQPLIRAFGESISDEELKALFKARKRPTLGPARLEADHGPEAIASGAPQLNQP